MPSFFYGTFNANKEKWLKNREGRALGCSFQAPPGVRNVDTGSLQAGFFFQAGLHRVIFGDFTFDYLRIGKLEIEQLVN